MEWHNSTIMDVPEVAGERLTMDNVHVTPFPTRISSDRDERIEPDTDDSKASSTFFIGSLAMREQGMKHSPGNDMEDFAMTPQSALQQQSFSPSPSPQPLFLRIQQTQLPTIGDNQRPPPPPPLEEPTKSEKSEIHVVRIVVPNFPGKSSSSSSQYFKEPLFFIPKVPELTKVPDPQPPKKAPLTGYDMRTLRKQIDYLQTEIQERMETQQLLYKQNEELWNYAQTLNQCNSSNANIMREQVVSCDIDTCFLSLYCCNSVDVSLTPSGYSKSCLSCISIIRSPDCTKSCAPFTKSVWSLPTNYPRWRTPRQCCYSCSRISWECRRRSRRRNVSLERPMRLCW